MFCGDVMTEEQRKVIEKAFDTLDRVDEQRAIWEAERETETPDQQYAREARERDDFNAEQERLERERFAQKRLRREQEQRKPKVQPGMTEADRQWVRDYIEAVTKMIAEEVIRRENELRVEIIKRRDQIWADIAALRADLTILQALHKASNVSPEGSVTSLRGRHVA